MQYDGEDEVKCSRGEVKQRTVGRMSDKVRPGKMSRVA